MEREIAMKRSKVQQQRMSEVENEILRLKQLKMASPRGPQHSESAQRETSHRIEKLQEELNRMTMEREEMERAQRENEEIRELKAMEHQNKEQILKREMSRMMR